MENRREHAQFLSLLRFSVSVKNASQREHEIQARKMAYPRDGKTARKLP
jgi:hypothetical protein